jgi:GH24 family phage-related lysozyme (muramidase)
MKLSRKGAEALLAEEGIVLSSYRDIKGVLTIGAGHTAEAGMPIPTPGLKISLEEALALFVKDVAKFERRIDQAIAVPLKQHEFDALVLFDYNTGAIFKGSVDDKLNLGEVDRAVATIAQYDKISIKGKLEPSEALKARRAREIQMFRKGEYFNRAIAVYDVFPGQARAMMPASLPWPDGLAPAPGKTDLPPLPDVPLPVPGPNESKSDIMLGWVLIFTFFVVLAVCVAIILYVKGN